MSQLERLTIYLAEGDRWKGRLLYRSLMNVAHSEKIAGMTVVRGAVGYGKRKKRSISVDWIIEFSMYLPIKVIVIDTADAIATFLARIQDRISSGIVVQKAVKAVHPTSDLVATTARSIILGQEERVTDFEQLTIYVRESDQWQGKPIYLALVEESRKAGLAGATVIRGIAGYGKRRQHHRKFFGFIELSSTLPMVVTIVDRSDLISQFLPKVQEMIVDRLVTRESINVLHPASLV